MFWNKKDKASRYSIIIIPERGCKTTTLNLSRLLLNITGIILVIAISTASVYLYLFADRYKYLSQDSNTLKATKSYIQKLEKDNKEKQEAIKSYKAYQDSINGKMEKLDKLEKQIQDKLDKSHFLKDTAKLQDTASFKTTYTVQKMSYLTDKQIPIEEIDSKIASLQKISTELDEALEKEKYIPTLFPCRGRITSEFGWRPNPYNYNRQENHKGLDIANCYGTEIHCTAKGTVIEAQYQSGFGNVVFIDHGNGLVSIYGHASKLCVSQGDQVEKGDVIALMGSTGRSTGSHVHFEIRRNGEPVDPVKLIQ